jgi:anti-sigma factor RsiW
MNNCDDIRMRAPLYLSGEMEGEDRDAFAAHLAKCSACAAKIAEDRNLDATLRSAFGGFAPDTGRLEQALRRKISVDRGRRRWEWAGAIAATVALLAVGAIAWAHLTRPPQWYGDAAFDHRREVTEGQPRRWRSNPAELAQLAAQNGLQLAQATAMAAAGYRLERAKICGIGDRRMLHLVFFNGTRRYSVFVSPHLGQMEAAQTVRQGTELIAGFETGHFRGLVVSDGSAAECAELARAAERQL